MECIVTHPHEVLLGSWHEQASLQRIVNHSCVILLTDTHVAEDWLSSLRKLIRPYAKGYCEVIMPAGDTQKTRETKAAIEDKLLNAAIDRDALILGVGGGVVCDMAGFVAATYQRGVAHAFWPTSTMAMLDAALGGKNGVNSRYGKNSIGTVTMPAWVLIDPDFLQTLPEKEARSGMAELIKHAILDSQNSCEQLLQQYHEDPKWTLMQQNGHWLRLSAQVKMRYVAVDPIDQQQRQWLNLGHTLAHAIEQVSGYCVAHGTAVAWGIWFEAALAKQQGILATSVFEIICQLLEDYQLLEALPVMKIDALLDAMAHDKKNRNGDIAFCLPAAMGLGGESKIGPVDKKNLRQMLQWMTKISALGRKTVVKQNSLVQSCVF